MKRMLMLLLLLLTFMATACTPAADVTTNNPTATPQAQTTEAADVA